MISIQEERKRDQEHKILYWLTLPQGLRLVLCQPAKISTNQDHQDQFTTVQTPCNRKKPLLPTANNPLHPTTVV